MQLKINSSANSTVYMCVLSRSVMSAPFVTPWTVTCQAPSVNGIFKARILEWAAISFLQGTFPTQGLNPHLLYLLHWQADFYHGATWEVHSLYEYYHENREG